MVSNQTSGDQLTKSTRYFWYAPAAGSKRHGHRDEFHGSHPTDHGPADRHPEAEAFDEAGVFGLTSEY